MKKIISAAVIILFVAGTSTAFARGNNYGHHDGYNRGHHSSSNHYAYRGGHQRHHNDGLGIAVGVVGGLLLGSAIINSVSPPPPTVVYGYPNTSYQREVVVQPSRICVEDRRVEGAWQTSRYNGRQVWVSYPYPVTQRVQVPCY